MRNKLIELIYDGLYVKKDDFTEGRIEKVADHLLANGVTIQRWIPVEERLPEKQGFYMVFHGESKTICGRFFYKDCPEAFGKVTYDPVTHWMPLPEPPKEQ